LWVHRAKPYALGELKYKYLQFSRFI